MSDNFLNDLSNEQLNGLRQQAENGDKDSAGLLRALESYDRALYAIRVKGANLEKILPEIPQVYNKKAKKV